MFEKCPDTKRSEWLKVHKNSRKPSKELLGEKESMRPKALRKIEIVLQLKKAIKTENNYEQVKDVPIT